jgi:hypothetical protein
MENCEVWKIAFKNVRGKYKKHGKIGNFGYIWKKLKNMKRKIWKYMEKKEILEIHGKIKNI